MSKLDERDATQITAEEPAPRKLLLQKRVLRHMNVRSGVLTGLANSVGDPSINNGSSVAQDPSGGVPNTSAVASTGRTAQQGSPTGAQVISTSRK